METRLDHILLSSEDPTRLRDRDVLSILISILTTSPSPVYSLINAGIRRMLSIIIVNFNTFEHLAGCLKSLSKQYDDDNYEIVVINNGSPSPTTLTSALTMDVRVINNRENLGYAAALNQGIQITSGDHILFLNADTRVKNGALKTLSHEIRSSTKIGVIAPRLEYPDGSLQYSCRRDYTPFSIAARRSLIGVIPIGEPALRRHLMLDEDHDRRLFPDWVQGSCFMVRRSVVSAVGGFDERFFLYFEDYDFCQRVRRHGFDVVYEPSSTVVHYYARSSRNERLHQREFWSHVRSAIRYYAKSRLRLPTRENLSTQAANNASIRLSR